MAAIGEAASIIAVVQLGERVLLLCGTYFQEVKGAKDDIAQLSKEVKSLKDALEKHRDIFGIVEPEIFKDIVEDSLEKLRGLEEQLNPETRRKKPSKFSLSKRLKWPFKSGEVQKTVQALHRNTTTLLVQIQAVRDLEDKVEKLRYCAEAVHCNDPSAKRARCLDNTRVTLLQHIHAWTKKKEAEAACIFWLRGWAGTGKSTISLTLADAASKDGTIVASFFFARNRGEQSQAKFLITTIAKQLANKDRDLKRLIGSAVAKNPEAPVTNLRSQWSELIVRPLESLQNLATQTRPILIIIDALDECEEQNDVQTLLELLPDLARLQSVNVRVFLTSRPDLHIKAKVNAVPMSQRTEFTLHDIEKEIIDEDIKRLFLHRFQRIKDLEEAEIEEEGWPGEGSISTLVERASGLFIYADTVCRFIEQFGARLSSPEDSLSILLERTSFSGMQSSPHSELDLIYSEILNTSIQLKDATVYEKFKKIIGPVVVILDTVGISTLASLLGFKEKDVKVVLNRLTSLLDISTTDKVRDSIRLIHPSFRDFLLDSERSPAHISIKEGEVHQQLLAGCLTVMREQLKKNCCGLEKLNTSILSLKREGLYEDLVERFSAELRYSCKYWFQHILRGQVVLSDGDNVHQFLKTHLLQWIETLSFLGADTLAAGITGIVHLERFACFNKTSSEAIKALLYDAKRFLWYFQEIIERCPLQLYSSALIFAPETSIVRNLYQSMLPECIDKKPVMKESWDACIIDKQIVKDMGECAGMSFSPDGRTLVVLAVGRNQGGAGTYGTAFDLLIGAESQFLDIPNEGLSDPKDCCYGWNCCNVEFLPSGEEFMVLAGSGVQVWNVSKGICVQKYESEKWKFLGLSISPSGKSVALTDNCGRLVLWDGTDEGARDCSLAPRDPQWADPRFPQIPPRIRTLADPCTMHDDTNFTKHPYEYPTHCISCFSPSGRLFASVFNSTELNIYEVKTGTRLYSLQVRLYCKSSTKVNDVLRFTKDEKLLVSITSDGCLTVWDMRTGREQQRTLLCDPAENEPLEIATLTVSPDCDQIFFTRTAAYGTSDNIDGMAHLYRLTPDSETLFRRVTVDIPARLFTFGGVVEAEANFSRFSPDGKFLAVYYGTVETRLLVFDLALAMKIGSVGEAFSFGEIDRTRREPMHRACTVCNGENEICDDTDDPKTPPRGLVNYEFLLDGEMVFKYYTKFRYEPDGSGVGWYEPAQPISTWDLAQGKPCRAELATWLLHLKRKGLSAKPVSPDGRIIYAVEKNGTIHVFDKQGKDSGPALEYMACFCRVLRSRPLQYSVFSPDTRKIGVINRDGDVEVWENTCQADDVRCEILEEHAFAYSIHRRLAKKNGARRQLLFSPDGKILVDIILRYLDIKAAGKQLHEVLPESGSDSEDSTDYDSEFEDPSCSIIVWDAETGTSLQVMERDSNCWMAVFPTDTIGVQTEESESSLTPQSLLTFHIGADERGPLGQAAILWDVMTGDILKTGATAMSSQGLEHMHKLEIHRTHLMLEKLDPPRILSLFEFQLAMAQSTVESYADFLSFVTAFPNEVTSTRCFSSEQNFFVDCPVLWRSHSYNGFWDPAKITLGDPEAEWDELDSDEGSCPCSSQSESEHHVPVPITLAPEDCDWVVWQESVHIWVPPVLRPRQERKDITGPLLWFKRAAPKTEFGSWIESLRHIGSNHITIIPESYREQPYRITFKKEQHISNVYVREFTN
ncbi:hypothetical protein BJ508DRAFT_315020 [Ascobolus immersus RN42]|uniref:NACHT domain-containing protein n=1 Tax=Ascobolus immersus RN42 TaxID=1160509 RepID=A0A3N4HJI6_ASCIM|nr:hypothetical protein BJ508DRAFT_315020 [Ascobolus immersus RN42]